MIRDDDTFAYGFDIPTVTPEASAAARRTLELHATTDAEFAEILAMLGIEQPDPEPPTPAGDPRAVHRRFTAPHPTTGKATWFYSCTRCTAVGNASHHTPAWPLCADCRLVLTAEERALWAA